MYPAFTVFVGGATEHRERFTIVRKDGVRVTLRLSVAPLVAEGYAAGAVVSFNRTSVERPAKPADLSAAQFDAFLDVASAGEHRPRTRPPATSCGPPPVLQSSGCLTSRQEC